MVVQKGTSVVMTKTPSVSSAVNYEQISQDPLKHVITFIEKKIRNLDKRKAKLDSYRKMVENGQTLDPDQKAAASKYDEVIGSLDFAKDLVKSFEMTMTEVVKIQRKTSRREQIAKEEDDNNRIRFVMRAKRIMELLHDNEILRNDFLNGTNRACVLSKLEMDQLVNFYELFIMDSYDAGTNILEDANSTGNHLYELAEARSKDIVGTTYKELHAVVERLNNCDYFEDLPDTGETKDLSLQQEKPEEDSVSSEASAEDALADDNALSPEASESLSSPTDFSADMSNDLPLKTEEFVPSTRNEAYVDDLTDASWNQQNLQTKPEAGDFIPQGMSFQFDGVGSNSLIPQTYQQNQVQTIQDVLADVQGPCQFLQDSVIEFEAPVTGLSFMSMQPVITTMQPHQMPVLTTPSHLRPRQLESGFTNASPMDNPTIISSQVAANGQQQHVTSSNDSSSHLSQTVNHSETANIKSIHDSLHMTSQQMTNQTSPSLNMDTVNYHSNINQANYVTSLPATTGSSRSSPQDVDYISHANQPDNLGLGQTTFGGQQQKGNGLPAVNNHPAYATSESTSYDQDKLKTEQYKSSNNYGSVTASNAYDSNAQSIAPNMVQHQLVPDPPTTHIPLPNEQQSGYRSYQPSDNPQVDMSLTAQSNEINQDLQGGDMMTTGAMPNQPHSQTQYDGLAEIRTNKDMQEGEVSQVESGVLPGQKQIEENHAHVDQVQGYRGSRPQQGVTVRSPRGGYNSSAGYNRPMNQGGPGGYHQQRNNYRVNNRYTGSYDSMGRPNNFSGYQNNQSSYMYRPPQDNSYNYRRGAGGNMRGRGHPQRGNARGNYNRSRTFRPQHPAEQSS